MSALSTFESYLAGLTLLPLDRPQNLSMTLLDVNKTEKRQKAAHYRARSENSLLSLQQQHSVRSDVLIFVLIEARLYRS